ncbi:hypothetical protein D3X11_01290 [Streptococcus sp. X16XC17]|uniref:cell wall synthase accessory phosphoprotein MacP n=1 Tax=unclassified Streptococcus TaxID=2608887 RepID=UPI00066FF6FE|nr:MULTISPECIES: cell wall synthase accessory phosphoprotein MacP [unclassified Streptococcus]TCD46124.1 hypothetical protein D3X11_01290 [Streptococcus sp. X16XC17]
MRKPLLTDDIIEQAKRKKRFGYYEPELDDHYDEYDDDYDEDEWDEFQNQETYHGYEEGQTIRIPVEQSIIKSRRIETIKKDRFRSKVNKILFWVIVLVIGFIVAVIYF